MVNPKEIKNRKIAIWVIGLMVVIWTILGIFSFVGRNRPQTVDIFFAEQSALKGKQVFQAYNCMDCHTIVGNGAYFAPDLTKIYEGTGPAWLLAYLGSPGTYPTEIAVKAQLNELNKAGEEKFADIDAYYTKYPKAKERVVERGGVDALMPNLKFTKDEIKGLIAFLKYTSQINTAGWPPKVYAKENVIEQVKREMEAKSGLPVKVTSIAVAGSDDSAEAPLSGADIAKNTGCIACHSTDDSVVVGPSWKSLYNSNVKLVDGTTVKADDAYLKSSILDPNKQIVHGFPKGVMISYDGVLSDQEVTALVDYIKTLK